MGENQSPFSSPIQGHGALALPGVRPGLHHQLTPGPPIHLLPRTARSLIVWEAEIRPVLFLFSVPTMIVATTDLYYALQLPLWLVVGEDVLEVKVFG